MATWVQKKLEENYLNQLDSILLQKMRLQNRIEEDKRIDRKATATPAPLSKLSNEINEELNRLEELLVEED